MPLLSGNHRTLIGHDRPRSFLMGRYQAHSCLAMGRPLSWDLKRGRSSSGTIEQAPAHSQSKRTR